MRKIYELAVATVIGTLSFPVTVEAEPPEPSHAMDFDGFLRDSEARLDGRPVAVVAILAGLAAFITAAWILISADYEMGPRNKFRTPQPRPMSDRFTRKPQSAPPAPKRPLLGGSGGRAYRVRPEPDRPPRSAA